MYSIVMAPVLRTLVVIWDPVKDDPEKAVACSVVYATTRAIARRVAQDFMVC